MKLTILFGFYNTPAHALLEAVNCLIRQEHRIKHNIILLDDGSTEPETIKARDLLYVAYADRLTVHFNKTNLGLAAVLNSGLRLVDTEYVALMGDDVCSLDRLRLQCEYLEQHPETDVLGTQCFSFYDDDIHRTPLFTSEHPEVVTEDNEMHWLVNHMTVVYRKSAVLAVGGYNEALRRKQDVDLWYRMFHAGYQFRNLPQVLYGWRKYR